MLPDVPQSMEVQLLQLRIVRIINQDVVWLGLTHCSRIMLSMVLVWQKVITVCVTVLRDCWKKTCQVSLPKLRLLLTNGLLLSRMERRL